MFILFLLAVPNPSLSINIVSVIELIIEHLLPLNLKPTEPKQGSLDSPLVHARVRQVRVKSLALREWSPGDKSIYREKVPKKYKCRGKDQLDQGKAPLKPFLSFLPSESKERALKALGLPIDQRRTGAFPVSELSCKVRGSAAFFPKRRGEGRR